MHDANKDGARGDDDDRSSISDNHGAVAHFEMAYSPDKSERHFFGPPITQLLGSFIFLVSALVAAAVIVVAHLGWMNATLTEWIVEGDHHRPIGSLPLIVLIVLSAIGTAVRAGMRGVVVSRNGIEGRYILAMGMPRIRKWSWAQIDRIVLNNDSVMLELWNGTYEHLPNVREGAKLASLLERIGAARGRTITRLSQSSTR
ncbi:MAG: hypothetical protein FWD69_18855 [Polyangiaceae bacterium]|nr:hypothetical protein [Polyangiaceae bacterium]